MRRRDAAISSQPARLIRSFENVAERGFAGPLDVSAEKAV